MLQKESQRKFEGAGMKWLRLRERLNQVPRVSRVVMEAVRMHAGVDAAHAYGGALAVVSEWCEQHGVPYEAFPVATVKKHATGKGNAKKDAMMLAASKKWPGIVLEDDNHADALWIGDLASRSSA